MITVSSCRGIWFNCKVHTRILLTHSSSNLQKDNGSEKHKSSAIAAAGDDHGHDDDDEGDDIANPDGKCKISHESTFATTLSHHNM